MVYGIGTSSKAQWIERLSVEAYIYVCANDPPIFGYLHTPHSVRYVLVELWVSMAPRNIHVKITVCYCVLWLLLLLLFAPRDRTLSLIVCLNFAFPLSLSVHKHREKNVYFIKSTTQANKTKIMDTCWTREKKKIEQQQQQQ